MWECCYNLVLTGSPACFMAAKPGNGDKLIFTMWQRWHELRIECRIHHVLKRGIIWGRGPGTCRHHGRWQWVVSSLKGRYVWAVQHVGERRVHRGGSSHQVYGENSVTIPMITHNYERQVSLPDSAKLFITCNTVKHALYVTESVALNPGFPFWLRQNWNRKLGSRLLRLTGTENTKYCHSSVR